jgi:hypothetical protein
MFKFEANVNVGLLLKNSRAYKYVFPRFRKCPDQIYAYLFGANPLGSAIGPDLGLDHSGSTLLFFLYYIGYHHPPSTFFQLVMSRVE